MSEKKYVRKIARRRVLDGDVMTIMSVRNCVSRELDRITRAGADSAVIADIQTKLHACALLQTVMEREIEKRWALGFSIHRCIIASRDTPTLRNQLMNKLRKRRTY